MLPPLVLLLIGSAYDGNVRLLLWPGAVAVDYGGIYVTGSSAGGSAPRATSPSATA
ncbi:hypothetical protein [Streptomyces sp. NPDC008121]|uniref:hypothetical protein n=1 Tax=Streptomyces sp. NPDC008121 TaxID=3364809 RepID=UPI0036EA247B